MLLTLSKMSYHFLCSFRSMVLEVQRQQACRGMRRMLEHSG